MPETVPSKIEKSISLKRYTTLKAGGRAEFFARVKTAQELAETALEAQNKGLRTTVIGLGSNILPSDDGVPGLTILNEAKLITASTDGLVTAETGCGFQELFLKTAQAGLGGLEFAVGIPGTLGGALVSNAGAYRSCVSEFLTELEIVFEGQRRWVEPSFLEFSYRDSILRKPNPPQCAVVCVRMQLPSRRPKDIYDEVRDYQRQRISKQPPPASAGSFFKNVNDGILAQTLDTLPYKLREAGVVPAGYLIEKSGLTGFRMDGAMFARRHANFVVNVGNASATDIRLLARYAKQRVLEEFGVLLEEEVLYLGDWSRFLAEHGPDPIKV